MLLLVQYTLIFASVLVLVALGGCFSEHGGVINIESGNDGINTNEDGVSVTTVNDGILNIKVNGSTGEGDGIDSNGWLVINGGSVVSVACGFSMDAGIDSDKGISINGGTVMASGNMLDEIAESEQTYVVFMTTETINGGTKISIKNESGDIVAETTIVNDCTCLAVSSETLLPGTYTLWKDGEKLSISEMNGGRFGMPWGGRFKPDGEPPRMPVGEVPELLEGEMPQPPERESERDFKEFESGGSGIGKAEASEEFIIKEGANSFVIAK